MASEPMQVLIVEDNPGDVRLIEEGIELAAVEAKSTVVPDGEAALEYLDDRRDPEGQPPPDLALVDLNLPKRRGSTVLQTIKAEPALRSVPVMILSGSDATIHIDECDALGADGYIIKPVDPAGFMSAVQTIIERVEETGLPPRGELTGADERDDGRYRSGVRS